MLPEYYDKFRQIYNDSLDMLLAAFGSMCEDGIDPDALTAYQQSVIDVCTGMEDTWLTGADEIVSAFEELCEMVYLLSTGESTDTSAIKHKLTDMHSLYDKCFKSVKCRFAIALMEKNEEKYLKEWLEYHLLMGAEHFYVYDHGSTDDSLEVLATYAKQGTVEIIPVEGEYLPTQIAVYNDALARARYSAEYLAFIDTDEFLTPMRHERAIDAIDDIFSTYENNPFKSPGSCAAGGIGVNWRVYGSSGHKTPADGLVIDEYRYRGPDDLMINAHIKTICKPLCVDKIINPHFAIYKPGYWCISEHGSLIPGAFFYDSRGDILRLNHYYVKSEEEYVTRRLNFKRSEAGRQRLATEEEVTHTNEVYDDCAVRFIPDGTYHQKHP